MRGQQQFSPATHYKLSGSKEELRQKTTTVILQTALLVSRRSRTEEEEDELNPGTLARNQRGCERRETALPRDTRCNYSELIKSQCRLRGKRKEIPTEIQTLPLPYLFWRYLKRLRLCLSVNKIQNQPGLGISSAFYASVVGFHPKIRSVSITNLQAQPEQQLLIVTRVAVLPVCSRSRPRPTIIRGPGRGLWVHVRWRFAHFCIHVSATVGSR